jgi:ribosomal protein L7/L12
MAEDIKISASVAEAVRSGRKIDAIKQLREERGIGLKEAKHIIDREIAALRASDPNYAQQNQSSSLSTILIIAALGLALYFYLTRGG